MTPPPRRPPASLGIAAAATLCAALLYDLIEDTYVDCEVMAREFGSETADRATGITKKTAT